MVWNGIKEKPHRLDPSNYIGFIRCDFTAKLRGRQQFFNNPSTFSRHEAILLTSLATHDCDAALYMFMPDHVHIVLQGRSDESDVRSCMADFKQRSGYELSQSREGVARWQKDFYDRILRDESEYRRKLNYILMNPIRAGLAVSWKEYPYWGSTLYSKDDLLMGAKY